jgi:hypothetical protein
VAFAILVESRGLSPVPGAGGMVVGVSVLVPRGIVNKNVF